MRVVTFYLKLTKWTLVVNKKTIELLCWLSISLMLCIWGLKILQPFLDRYEFIDDKSFEQIALNDAEDYQELVSFRYKNILPVRSGGGVNPLFSMNLPVDLSQQTIDDKTEIFISLIAPEAIRVNKNILSEREKLKKLIAKKTAAKSLTSPEKWWLNLLLKKYRVKSTNLNELLGRVDVIPCSLILAQAITESGWGTSRFAQRGNALYGQHLAKSSKEAHVKSLSGGVKVASFDSVLQATTSYANNLNRHKAYQQLREIRRDARKKGTLPNGAAMAEGLLRYSEIGERYVGDLQFLIKKYKLEMFDTADFEENYRGATLVFSR